MAQAGHSTPWLLTAVLSVLLFNSCSASIEIKAFAFPSPLVRARAQNRHEYTVPNAPHITGSPRAIAKRGAPLTLTLTPLQADVVRTVAGAALAAKVSIGGYKKKRSLSKWGAISAFSVATLALSCSVRSGMTLLAFYLTSSKLTRLGTDRKKTLEEGYKVGGRRGASQVLACSAVGVAVALARRALVGHDGPVALAAGSLSSLGNRLTLAYVAFFACCAGDTWASELGVLSKSDPRLVTRPWKKAAPGTNGAVSIVGLVASAAGGMLMGVIHGLLVPGFGGPSLREVGSLSAVGLAGGLGGSLLDSILGATIQATYYDPVGKVILKKPTETSETLGIGFLSNEMVNVVSTTVTALLAGLFPGPLLSWIAF